MGSVCCLQETAYPYQSYRVARYCIIALYFSYTTISSIRKHNDRLCFAYFKQCMEQRYGSKLKWFGIIANQSQARKIKLFQFKCRIAEILKGSPHQNCCQAICRKFIKNKKNQIQWAAFLNMVRFIQQKYDKKSKMRIQKQPSPQKQTQIQQQIDYSVHISPPTNNLHSFLKQNRLKNIEKNIKLNKSRKQSSKFTSNRVYTDEDQFLMKSSLQISKQYQQVIQKFGNYGHLQSKKKYEGTQSSKKMRNRVNSAKQTHATGCHAIDSPQTTLTNWRSAANGQNIKKSIKTEYFSNWIAGQNFQGSKKQSSRADQSRVRIKSMANNRNKTKFETEPICSYEDF